MKKRWFIAIIILVVIAVVLAIVFINLFKTRTTKGLAENLNTYVATGYLAAPGAEQSRETTQYETIDDYLKTLSTNSQLSDNEKNTILNERAALHAYSVAVSFYNRHVIFMQVTETFQKQKGGIQSALKKAQNAANSLEKYINKNRLTDLVSGVIYWEAETFPDTKGFLADIFNFTTDAVNRLGEVYLDCMPVANKDKDLAILNNSFAKLVINQTKTLTENVTNGMTDSGSHGTTLETFCNAYFSALGEQLIASYPYDANLQRIVLDINTLGSESEYYLPFVAGGVA